MKIIKIAALLLFSATLVQAQDVTVRGNTKLNNDFKQYKTFSWAKSDETAPQQEYVIYSYTEKDPMWKGDKMKSRKDKNTYIYSYNVIIPAKNPTVNTAIKGSIKEEMEGRGYTPSANADLFVAYRVLERKGQMKGYINDEPTMVNGVQVHTSADTTTYALAPGTLIITLVDAKTSEVVWDGFASGLFQNNSFQTDEIKLKEAVHLIFNEFKYTGDKSKAGGE